VKLLVVDDSKLYQKATARFFRELIPELDLYFALDGEEGYKMYKEVNPNVMTIDLLMPKMNGIELLKKIQEEDHNCQLFVLSADVQKLVREEVESLGATFFNKPLTAEKAAEIAEMIKG
jgi:two-component system chemotaxis response regulator CheY